MDYVHLGRTGLKVSRLCLGTMNFGVHTEEKDSHRILDAALESGINFIDTANVYGNIYGGSRTGLTEEILGHWFAADPKNREKVVLATKVYGNMSDEINDRGLSAYNIRQACNASLRRMKTDHIDLYQMHHVDRSTPWEEIWQAMEQLVREGKILYVGSSNFAGWHIARANETASRRHFFGLVSEQSIYNLNNRSLELEVLPACREYGMGVIPWSPLDRGLLGGVLNITDGARRSRGSVAGRIEELRPQLETWEAFCESRGDAPAAVALAWLLHQPDVTAPIVGPRTLEQFQQHLKALETTLSEEELQQLDEIWPGPGGTAPEAYAW
jgi:aryl-alcohol dehydrogenase-like predicted oxidoreductase